MNHPLKVARQIADLIQSDPLAAGMVQTVMPRRVLIRLLGLDRYVHENPMANLPAYMTQRSTPVIIDDEGN